MVICREKETNLFQKYPQKEEYSGKIDLSIEDLHSRLEGCDGEVFAYVVDTVEWNENKRLFAQKGCSPNFEGGAITLAACKHKMRASSRKRASEWKNVWIAGFTAGRLFYNKRSYLFFLMRVCKAFPSHEVLWNHLDEQTRETKNARYNPLGDVYEPKSETKSNSDDLNHLNYYKPCVGHAHRKEKTNTAWHNDISYRLCKKYGNPLLLLGDKENSYLWFSRFIPYKNGKHPYHQRMKIYKTVEEFMSMLL